MAALAASLIAGFEHARGRSLNLTAAAQQSPTQQRVRFRVPADAELRDSAYRASAFRGRALLLATRDSLPRNVGNSLRCASCHLNNGLLAGAMPWVGAYARFPQFRARSGKVDLIEDRINDCFKRSMNGRALDPTGRDMRDIVSYFAFLSIGVPVGSEIEGQGLPRLQPLKGDLSRGASVFVSSCARCHGANGMGTPLAPPLWGASLVQRWCGNGTDQYRRLIHSRCHADRSGAEAHATTGVRRRDLCQHAPPPELPAEGTRLASRRKTARCRLSSSTGANAARERRPPTHSPRAP